MKTIIKPKPLTAEAFKAFGDVIEMSDNNINSTINDGHTELYRDLAEIDVLNQKGSTCVNLFKTRPLPQPISIEMMERHPLASQAFMPLGNQPYLVVVAPQGEFDIKNIKVFLAASNQGVNYHAGTWHHYCLALHEVSNFLVIDRKGEGYNCDVLTLDGSLVIEEVMP